MRSRRVAVNNKVRIIDKTGRFVGKCSFDALTGFGENCVARSEKNGKWSIIGADGKELTRLKFDSIGPFSYNGIAMIEKNGLYGYINKCGEIIIKPQFFEAMDFNHEGYAAVKTCKRWQIINERGEFVTTPLFDRVIGFSRNGLSPVVVDDKWGYINFRGDYIVEPQYLYADAFDKNDLATVKRKGEVLVVNSDGTVVLGPFSQYRSINCDYAKTMGIMFGVDSDGLYNILGIDGKPVSGSRYENYDVVELNGKSMLFVQQNKKWGLLNSDLKEIISPRYASYRSEFYGIICEGCGNSTYINHLGEIIADQFKTYKYSSDHLLINIKDEWFSIDKNGTVERVSDLALFSHYPSWIKVKIDEIHLPRRGDVIDTREFFVDYYERDAVRGYNLYNF